MTFWDDLSEQMEDPEFRALYAKVVEEFWPSQSELVHRIADPASPTQASH